MKNRLRQVEDRYIRKALPPPRTCKHLIVIGTCSVCAGYKYIGDITENQTGNNGGGLITLLHFTLAITDDDPYDFVQNHRGRLAEEH